MIGAEFFKSFPNFLPIKKPIRDKPQVIIPIRAKEIMAVVILYGSAINNTPTLKASIDVAMAWIKSSPMPIFFL